MSKGQERRALILQQALDLSSEVGLDGLTVGNLAKRTGMSKSGLYAHFESKEDLQKNVLDTANERFVRVVMLPAIKRPRGLPRVKTLFELWLNWSADELSGGCPVIAAAAEFDDRPGPVRDHLVANIRQALETIARAARISIEEGHFRKNLDIEQFAYEFWSILLVFQFFYRLLGNESARARARNAFSNLIDKAKA